MSHICGIVRFDGKRVSKEDIRNMLDTDKDLEYDDEGIWTGSNAGFGYKTFWTTPESKYEIQPVFSEDKNLVLIADARIDNRNELIEELNPRIKSFGIITDAELILRAYQKWGKECPKHLYGDFSFCIWDTHKNEFYASRDRMGIRQLYYYYDKKFLVFASSPGDIFTSGIVSKEINIEAVKKFLKSENLNRNETFYKNIERLYSSHWICLSDNAHQLERYWFPEDIKTNTSISLEEATKKFSHLFDSAIQSCLRSAYPVSIEVSGGVDSSSVYSSIMSKNISEPPIEAHTIYYRGLPSDEIKYVEMLEKEFTSEIVKFDINNMDFERHDLSFFYSKFPDSLHSGVFLEIAAKNIELKQRGVRVVLTGAGADELLGGSDLYMLHYLKKFKFKQIYHQLLCTKLRFKTNKSFIKYFFSVNGPFLGPMKEKINETIRSWGSNSDSKNDLYGGINLNHKIQNDYMASFGIDFLALYFTNWMDFSVLQGFSKDGIEVRHPFFDTRFVEFIISLPPEYLYNCGEYKNILILAMDGIVPDELLYRRSKASLTPSLELQLDRILAKDKETAYQELYPETFFDDRDMQDLKNKYYSDIITTSELIRLWKSINLYEWLKN